MQCFGLALHSWCTWAESYYVDDDPQVTDAAEQPLLGETWVITGTFAGKSRDDVKTRLESLEAKVSGSVSAKTTVLAAGGKAGSKKTVTEAAGVRIVEEDELLTMI